MAIVEYAVELVIDDWPSSIAKRCIALVPARLSGSGQFTAQDARQATARVVRVGVGGYES